MVSTDLGGCSGNEEEWTLRRMSERQGLLNEISDLTSWTRDLKETNGIPKSLQWPYFISLSLLFSFIVFPRTSSMNQIQIEQDIAFPYSRTGHLPEQSS